MLHNLAINMQYYLGMVAAATLTATLWRLESLLFWRGWPVTYLTLGLPLAYFSGAAGLKSYGPAGLLLVVVAVFVSWPSDSLMRRMEQRQPIEIELKLGCALLAVLAAVRFSYLVQNPDYANESFVSLLLWATLPLIFYVDLYMYACSLLSELCNRLLALLTATPGFLGKVLGSALNLPYAGIQKLTDYLASKFGTRR
jgi:hypothetical protein